MRARVVDARVSRPDDVEVAQRRVTKGRLGVRGGPGLVGDEPLPDELGLAIGGGWALGKVLDHERHIRGPVHRGAGREHDLGHSRRRHRLEHDPGALDVLVVRVQGPGDRDAGVLVAGDMDDALDLMLAQRFFDELAVEDGAAHKGHSRRHEAVVSAGQVIDDDRGDPRGGQRADDVGTDVSGTAGDKPAHGFHPVRSGITLRSGRGVRRGRSVRSPSSRHPESARRSHWSRRASPALGRRACAGGLRSRSGPGGTR